MKITASQPVSSVAHQAEASVRLYGLRFGDPQTERRYYEWRVATAMPFAQIGYIGSAPSWVAFLVAVALLSPASLPIAGPAIAGWVLFLLLLAALTLWGAARQWVMPLAAFANGLAGFLVAWLLHEVVATSMDMEVRAGVMSGGVLIVMYFGFAIFRIPPWLAMLGVTPYLLFSLSYLYGDAQIGNLEPVVAGMFAAIQLVAYFGGVLVSVVIEMVTRRAFIKDQIIQLQQQELSKSRDAIRRYVPPSVAERIINGDPRSIEVPARRRVTMLFCDIVGFTDIADRVEPEVMTQVLGDYLFAMSDLIDRHGGTLNEFAGDGLMALFGAPDEAPAPKQAQSSIKAALAMQAKVPELNESWRVLGLGADLRVRIGINTGMVSVGSYGSSGRMTYTAVGMQTNIASRIERAAEPGGIWVSDATYQLARDEFPFKPRGEVECKGVHYPVKVFEVLWA